MGDTALIFSLKFSRINMPRYAPKTRCAQDQYDREDEEGTPKTRHVQDSYDRDRKPRGFREKKGPNMTMLLIGGGGCCIAITITILVILILSCSGGSQPQQCYHQPVYQPGCQQQMTVT